MTFTFVGTTSQTYAMDQIKNIVKDWDYSNAPPPVEMIYVLLNNGHYDVYPATAENINSMNAWVAQKMQSIKSAPNVSLKFEK
jgi:hypothetical protein